MTDRRRVRGAIARVLAPLVAFAVAAGAWQIAANHEAGILPSLGAIGSGLSSQVGLDLRNAGVTLGEAMVGLGAGFSVAFVLAIAMSEVRVLERALMPLAVMINVTPIVAIAPGLTLVFGLGLTPRYVLTALIVFFPFLVNAMVGLRAIDRESLEVLETLNASRAEVLLRLRLPSSLPFLFAASRVCVPLSIVGAVVSEFTTAGVTNGVNGLGWLVFNDSTQPGLIGVEYGAIVWLAGIGIVLTGLVVLAERRFLSWYGVGRRPQR